MLAVSISVHDLLLIGFLAFLEGILSIDNAVVLALLARHLPPAQRKKALSYGLIGSVVFRLGALTLASRIIQLPWVRLVGGGYLLSVGLRHLVRGAQAAEAKTSRRSFWATVVVIELLDIAFALDSILAAVAVSQKLWIVFTGGMIGVLLIRVAAGGFLTVLKRFPRFEDSAYLLITLIGLKLILEGLELPGVDFHSSRSPAFWGFWGASALSLAYGFVGRKLERPRT